MAAAAAAAHLGAGNDHLPILGRLDGVVVARLEEARPSRARVELCVRAEQLGAAAGAAVHTLVVGGPQLACEGALGAGPAEHPVLLGRELLAPLLLGLLDFVDLGGHSPSFARSV